MGLIRILFIADTHLGFDYPFRPRVRRRRRGPDFFKNFDLALQPAHRGEVHLVVHGGDIFYRSRVPARLVDMAFQPLKSVADKGVPVYVVPGNHERSSIPYQILAAHSNVFVFDRPACFIREVNGMRISLAGFPFLRHGIRARFNNTVQSTGWQNVQADIHILCMHQSVDGATMGPKNFMFRGGDDVVDIRDIPAGFAAVLTGHMHRHQVLRKDLRGRPLTVPVIYAGSIERTSFAEKDEIKGYMMIELVCSDKVSWRFHELPTRPMVSFEIDVTALSDQSFACWLKDKICALPADSIVKIKIRGKLCNELLEMIRAESLRTFAPETMNIDITVDEYRRLYRETAK